MKTFWKIVGSSFLVFFFSWMLVYKTGLNPLSIQSEDILPAMFLPVTILKEGTFYVDTYYEMLLECYPHPDDKGFIKDLTPFYLKKVGDHYISAFTLMAGLLALPVYFLPVVFGMSITWGNLSVLAHISSSLIMAFSGGFLYLLLKDSFFLKEKKAGFLIFIYLFGSINYALVSQGLWQHGAVQLFTILSLLFLYKKNWFLTGLMFGLMILARPTAVIAVFFLGLLILVRQCQKDSVGVGRVFLQGAFGILLPLLFFLWYNAAYYVNIANQGYASQIFTEWKSNVLEGFLGQWISPSKGILVYSPVFLFSFVGFGLAVRKKSWRDNIDYILFLCIIILHIAVMGKWKHWYGGYSFGYRMAVDILPFLTLLMIPFIRSSLFERLKVWFFTAFVYSILVQLFGMVFFDGIWHAAYDEGFEDTSWLWSVKDSEFMFNIRRIFVKLGILEKACPKCLPKN